MAFVSPKAWGRRLKVGVHEHNIGGFDGNVGAASHGDADMSQAKEGLSLTPSPTKATICFPAQSAFLI
jgi:hypothetical protein